MIQTDRCPKCFKQPTRWVEPARFNSREVSWVGCKACGILEGGISTLIASSNWNRKVLRMRGEMKYKVLILFITTFLVKSLFASNPCDINLCIDTCFSPPQSCCANRGNLVPGGSRTDGRCIDNGGSPTCAVSFICIDWDCSACLVSVPPPPSPVTPPPPTVTISCPGPTDTNPHLGCSGNQCVAFASCGPNNCMANSQCGLPVSAPPSCMVSACNSDCDCHANEHCGAPIASGPCSGVRACLGSVSNTSCVYSGCGLGETCDSSTCSCSVVMVPANPCGPGVICGQIKDIETDSVPLSQRPVELRNTNGTFLKTAYTDDQGKYQFTALAQGNYFVSPPSNRLESVSPMFKRVAAGGLSDFKVKGTFATVTVASLPNTFVLIRDVPHPANTPPPAIQSGIASDAWSQVVGTNGKAKIELPYGTHYSLTCWVPHLHRDHIEFDQTENLALASLKATDTQDVSCP